MTKQCMLTAREVQQLHNISKGKGKAIPLQALTGPEGSRRLVCEVSINVWRLAGYAWNISCNFLHCNHQVHRDFLITLYIKLHEDGSTGSEMEMGQVLASMLAHTHACAHAHKHKVG
jgi:hypothetical protein